MSYTVHQLAHIAGVSVRALHHYDDIGLLSPTRQPNGYRSYGERELLRLQQILFFRELEVPLEEIKRILAQPDFDIAASLREHRVQIERKRARLAELVRTIDGTLSKIAGDNTMSDEALFEAFWEKYETEYAAEAEERWGKTDAWKQSQERTKHLSKEDYKRLAKEGELFMTELATFIDAGPMDPHVQQLIREHYESLRTYYDPTPELYRGLGNMYVDDGRFRAYFERFDPRMPEFMRDAMHAFCDRLGA